jgi:hypothetical protein
VASTQSVEKRSGEGRHSTRQQPASPAFSEYRTPAGVKKPEPGPNTLLPCLISPSSTNTICSTLWLCGRVKSPGG